MQAKYIYDMIRCDQTYWMATKSMFVEMPINEFWGFENDLPPSSQNMHPPDEIVPSRLGHEKPASRVIL